MKIGFFTDGYLPQLNGVATSVASSMKALEKLGHEVYIIAPKYPRMKEEKNVFRLTSLKVHRGSDIRVVAHLPEKSLLDASRIDFDIIHGHAGGPVAFLGWEIAKLRNIPFVFTYHTLWNKYTHYFFKGRVIRPRMIELASRIFGNRSDALIAPTKKVKDELITYGIETPIYIIPSGIDVEQFTYHKKGFLRKKLKIAEDQKVLLYVGRLGKEKSVDFLIKSFAEVAKDEPNVHLVLVGEGDETQQLKELTRQLGIASHVHFAGGVSTNNMPKVYADGDIFVFASRTETQGLVILEAMSAGLPVVAVADKSLYRVITSGITGILVEGNHKKYAKEIKALLHDPLLHQKLVHNAQQTVIKYSSEQTALALERLYERLVEKHAQKGNIIQKVNLMINSYSKEFFFEQRD